MAKTVLLLGSNIEPRMGYIQAAIDEISVCCGRIVLKSSMYESEAWGFNAEKFLNMVIVIQTWLTPLQLLEQTQAIEQKLGRTKKSDTQPGYQSRTIDVDILFYDDLQINTHQLVVPHPRLGERRFTLVPLCEILPYYVHPTENKTMAEMLLYCRDKGSVTKFNP